MTNFATKKTLGQGFFWGPHLLRKVANMQKSNELKKLYLVYFSKVIAKLPVFTKLKTSCQAFLKKARREVFRTLKSYCFFITFEKK